MSEEHEEQQEKTLNEWFQDNPWFHSDPVLRAAAIEEDQNLETKGMSPGRDRLDKVEKKMRAQYPERFFDHPERPPKWNDIRDPGERKAAKAALKKFNKGEKIAGRKGMSEEEYLRTYLES